MGKTIWTGWAKRHLWPAEPQGFVFLGHAFDALGTAMWPDWNEYEVEDAERDVPRQIPTAAEAYIDGVPHYGFHKEYGPYVRSRASWLADDAPIPVDLWHAVATHNRQDFNKVRLARMRRDSVVSVCHQLAQEGELAFAWRRFGGGMKPALVRPDEWEIDYPFIPFATLGYSEAGGLSSPNPTGWLFVTLDSLDSVLGGPAASTVPADLSEPDAPIDRLAELAGQLDAAGVPKRLVSGPMIRERWRPEWGRIPKVSAVTNKMTGGGKGGRPVGS